MDIEVSSYQLDKDDRGFSYNKTSYMRMDKNQKFSAYEFVNEYSENDIANVLYKYEQESRIQEK